MTNRVLKPWTGPANLNPDQNHWTGSNHQPEKDRLPLENNILGENKGSERSVLIRQVGGASATTLNPKL